jgi:hypothetical protein
LALLIALESAIEAWISWTFGRFLTRFLESLLLLCKIRVAVVVPRLNPTETVRLQVCADVAGDFERRHLGLAGSPLDHEAEKIPELLAGYTPTSS